MKGYIGNRLCIDFSMLELFYQSSISEFFFAMEHSSLAISDGKVTSNHAFLPLLELKKAVKSQG